MCAKEKTLYIDKVICKKSIKYTLRNENHSALSTLCVEEETQDDKEYYLNEEYENKKVLYLTDFATTEQFRNKGYGKYLLTEIIKRFKRVNKYDLIHLNACPFYLTVLDYPIYRAPKNGLDMDKLIQFYKTNGFQEFQEKQTHYYKCMVMIMNLK